MGPAIGPRGTPLTVTNDFVRGRWKATKRFLKRQQQKQTKNTYSHKLTFWNIIDSFFLLTGWDLEASPDGDR